MSGNFEKARKTHMQKLEDRKPKVWKVAKMHDGTYAIQAPIGYYLSGMYFRSESNAKIVCDIVNLEAQDSKSVFYLG